MNICPHCKTETISFSDKWFSSSAYPARCAHCDGLSLVTVTTSSGIQVACILGFVVLGLAAALWESVVPFWFGTPLIVCFYVWRWRVAPLAPTFSDAAANARNAGWIITAFFALLSIFR